MSNNYRVEFEDTYFSKYQPVYSYSKGPPVTLMTVISRACVSQHFGGDEPRCSASALESLRFLVGETKVAEYDVAVPIDEDVLGLEVAMCESRIMNLLQANGQLNYIVVQGLP